MPIPLVSQPILYPYIRPLVTAETNSPNSGLSGSSVNSYSKNTGTNLAERLERLLTRSIQPSAITVEHAVKSCVEMTKLLLNDQPGSAHCELLRNKAEYWCRDILDASSRITSAALFPSLESAMVVLRESGNNAFQIACGLLNLKIAVESAVPGLAGKANFMSAQLVRDIINQFITRTKEEYEFIRSCNPQHRPEDLIPTEKHIDLDYCRAMHLVQAYDYALNPAIPSPTATGLVRQQYIEMAQKTLADDYSMNKVLDYLTAACIQDLRLNLSNETELKPEDLLQQHYNMRSGEEINYDSREHWQQFLSDEIHATETIRKFIKNSLDNIGWRP